MREDIIEQINEALNDLEGDSYDWDSSPRLALRDASAEIVRLRAELEIALANQGRKDKSTERQ